MIRPYISLIIPVYNEEERLQNSLEKIIDYFDKQTYSYEILIVDDGSKDKTIEIANKYLPKVVIYSYGENKGKGAAVKYGMLKAKGEICIFTDADLSTPIYEIDKMLNEFENKKCDIVIGNRAAGYDMIKIHQPWYREFMGKTFNKFVQLFVFKGISDTQCGFKGFRYEAAQKIFNKTEIQKFGFDVEILYLALKSNFDIRQIKVEWYNDARSKVNPIKDSIQMFKDILRIKKLHKNTVFPLKLQ